MLSLLPRHSNCESSLLFSHSHISLPRKGGRVGLRNVLFEDCSAFTHVTACTLALPPYFAARFTGGFNHFVTSTVAPVASGWSYNCRVGIAPTGKRRLVTAHTQSSHFTVAYSVPKVAAKSSRPPQSLDRFRENDDQVHSSFSLCADNNQRMPR